MMLSCCGNDCETCNAFIATRDDNDELRASTAAEWSELYNHSFSPEDVNCTGCHGDGAKIGFCQICGIAKCCSEKGFDNCSQCRMFVCETLDDFWHMIPPEDAEKNRKRLQNEKAEP